MSPLVIRRLVIIVFVAGIAGMIVGSIRDNNGTAITFGLITAAAAVGLILVTSVAPPGAFRRHRGAPPPRIDEELAADLERRIQALVGAGADEEELRRLVARALEARRTEAGPI